MKDHHRNIELDIVKGIGMVLMVVAHTYGPESLFWRMVYPFHMPLFYIISGYFFKGKETLTIIKASYTRLIKPYLFICITVILIKYVQHLTNPNIQFLNLYSILNGIGPGWFLLSLFWSRLFFNYIIRIIPKHYFIASLFISSIVVITYPILPLLTHLSLPQGLSCLFFLAIGYFTNQNKILSKLSCHSYLVLFLSVLSWMVTFFYGKVEVSTCTYKLWFIDYLGAIGGTCICYYTARYINRHTHLLSTFFCKISKYSIAILSFHAIDFNIFIWYHFDGMIKSENMLTFITLGRLIIIFLSVFITSRIPFLYHLFVGKDK